MRLWTLHPEYLDPRGLVALWREALLAQHVLQGGTVGYRHHPQLFRFREAPDPIAAIVTFLRGVADEAARRDFSFDESRIAEAPESPPIVETDGQLAFEWKHLKDKLARRSPDRHARILQIDTPGVHPLFTITPGPRREWEKG